MKKIKILHILEAVGGGTKKALMLQLKYLDSRDFDITVCIPPRNIIESVRVNELNDPEFGAYLTKLGYRVVEIEMYGGTSLKFIRNLLGLWKLYRFCRRHRFDIVHGHSATAGFVGRLAAKMAGVPVTIYSPEGFAFSDYSPKVRRLIVIGLEKLAGLATNMVVACSGTEKQQALDAGIIDEDRITVIENPIDLESYSISPAITFGKRCELVSDNGTRIIGMVARLAPQKNPLDFVRMANLVARKRADVLFVLVGDGRMRQEVESLINDLHLADRVLLLGNREDYLQIMSCFDVFVLTSLWEGLPYAPVESLLLEIPIVITNVTGALDIVGEDAAEWLVQPRDVEEMASKILTILENPDPAKEFARKMSQKNRHRFDGNITSRKISNLYRTLLSGKRGFL